ncbi:hypothetical protein GGS21DRAFT_489225 [Xylaria nigripes]|nr:hypothetical protein GGS21DRAFT_489225 [Xylaria nigripes]
MANRGDMDLARQLQAEFSRAKQPKRSGERVVSQPHAQHGNVVHSRGGNRDDYQGGPRPSVPPSQPPQLRPDFVNSFSRRPDSYITSTHTPLAHSQRPGSSAISTFSQAGASGRGGFQEPKIPVYSAHSRMDDTEVSGSTPYQTTNQVSRQTGINPPKEAPVAALQKKENIYPRRSDEDMIMADGDITAASAPKRVTIPRQKTLADSIWNPANQITNPRSESSQTSPQTRSNESSPVEVAKNYMPPGLRASRWCDK